MYLAHGGSDFIAILSDWARLAIVKRVVCRRCGGAVLPLADGAQRTRVLGDVLEVLVEAVRSDFEIRAGGAGRAGVGTVPGQRAIWIRRGYADRTAIATVNLAGRIDRVDRVAVLVPIGAKRARCARPGPVGVQAVRDGAGRRNHAAVVQIRRIGLAAARKVVKIVRTAQEVPCVRGVCVRRDVERVRVGCRNVSVIALLHEREREKSRYG